MALSKTTQDHEEIQQWAERRGAKPAEVSTTEKSGEPGILRIMFPKAPHANDSSLKEISWDEFFEKFDENRLALVYQEVTSEGAESNFNKLIHPDDEDHPARSASKKSSAKKSAAKKSPRKSAKKSAKKTATKRSSSGK